MRAADTPPTGPVLDRRRDGYSRPSWLHRRTRQSGPYSRRPRRSHRVSKWFRAASGNGHLVREGQPTELVLPRPRNRTQWEDSLLESTASCHAWTDGSLRRSARLGWVVTPDG